MKQVISDYVNHCTICQQAKHSTTLPAGLLNSLPIPSQVWEDISMDFITGLPNSCGFTIIFVIVDRLTKFGHFLPLKADYDSKVVAEAFMQHVVKLHGMPKSIVSDRDKVFTCRFWQHLFKLQGTTLAICFTFHNPKIWAKILHWAQYWYNTSFQTNAAMTPFKALYGRDPPTLTRSSVSINQIEGIVSAQLISREHILSQFQQNLHKAQQVMKGQADKKRKHVELEIGDLVLVKLQPYRQVYVAARVNHKRSLKYFGPFLISAKIGYVAYKVVLPPTARIHLVFHVSHLKKFLGNANACHLKGSLFVPQVLVKWQDMDDSFATWEDKKDMELNFPNFNLKVKVHVNKGSIIVRENDDRERER
ncbi:hypothetical protein A2U01_0007319 [Trifolium medium]|uniref:Integrase catalytic domain-containing protein n=1 Tax=Trifolium medium TaxID=97028 RepID=A0A392MG41_9FABA|nr:hypothetical protein [Trifolium medium]